MYFRRLNAPDFLIFHSGNVIVKDLFNTKLYYFTTLWEQDADEQLVIYFRNGENIEHLTSC